MPIKAHELPKSMKWQTFNTTSTTDIHVGFVSCIYIFKALEVDIKYMTAQVVTISCIQRL